MKITIQDEVYHISHDTEAVSIIEVIQSSMQRSNRYVKRIMVDGQEISDDLIKYLGEHANSINDIDIITVPEQEYVDELLFTNLEYLAKLEKEIPGLIDKLYIGLNESQWKMLIDLIEGIEYITYTLGSISHASQTYEEILNKGYVERLHSFSIQLHGAMQSSDNTLMADTIQYELVPLLSEIQVDIQLIIQSKGVST